MSTRQAVEAEINKLQRRTNEHEATIRGYENKVVENINKIKGELEALQTCLSNVEQLVVETRALFLSPLSFFSFFLLFLSLLFLVSFSLLSSFFLLFLSLLLFLLFLSPLLFLFCKLQANVDFTKDLINTTSLKVKSTSLELESMSLELGSMSLELKSLLDVLTQTILHKHEETSNQNCNPLPSQTPHDSSQNSYQNNNISNTNTSQISCEREEQKEEKQKSWNKLETAIIIDSIGFASYLFPGFGEIIDVVWAPISSLLVYRLFGNAFFAKMALVEELLPGVDFIPTASIAYIHEYVHEQYNLDLLTWFNEYR